MSRVSEPRGRPEPSGDGERGGRGVPPDPDVSIRGGDLASPNGDVPVRWLSAQRHASHPSHVARLCVCV